MGHNPQGPSPFQSIVAGAAAGGVESLVTVGIQYASVPLAQKLTVLEYPTEYIKTRKQLLHTSVSPLRLLTSAVRESGPGILYTGASAFCVSNSAKSGVRFLTFDMVRDRLPKNPETGKPTKVSNMLAGVAAGVAESVTVVTPGENVKTKIVEDRAGARQYKSTSHAIQTIVNTGGVRGLFRGVLPVTMKQGSNALVRFTCYNSLLDTFQPAMKQAGYEMLAPAVAGAMAGVVTVYATMPFDVIKTKMQRLATPESQRGTWQCFVTTVQESGLVGLWKGTTPRLARLSCDGQVPACTNCAKAGQICLDVDNQNSGLLVPRNFTSSAKARIQWLEDIIKERLPDVDLASGPQVDAYPDPNPLVSGDREHADDDGQSPPITSNSLRTDDNADQALTTRQSPLKRLAEGPSPDGADASFPERAHSIALNLGMLSLNSDSSQRHYIGSSSGLLFTHLIGATPSSTSSPSVTGAEASEAEGSGWATETAELPRKEDALVLAHTYIRWIHPDYPVLEPSSLLSALDALYSCVAYSLENDSFPHGWPSEFEAFRWNGRLVSPHHPDAKAIPMPVIAFIIFMVFNIAAIVKVRSRTYEYPPDRFYRAASHFSKDAFSQTSLPSIQALVCLITHSMLTPADVNLWTLIHIALAHCVELGIHREEPLINSEDLPYQQIRRFTFFTIYSLDRSISSIQGRPLGFRDETFDIKMPEPEIPQASVNSNIAISFSLAVTRYSVHHWELDRIISDIKLLFYHLPGTSVWYSRPMDPPSQQRRIREMLVNWWGSASADNFSATGLDNRQRQIWRLKLKIKYHSAMVMLFQPSQILRNPGEESLQTCFNNASCILHDYQQLHDLHGLHHGWRTVQNIFAAGATIIYSFWTSAAVRRNASTADLSKNLRTCSSLITVGGEWWPSVKKGQASFGSLADLTIQRLYTDSTPSKHPRLMHQDAEHLRSQTQRNQMPTLDDNHADTTLGLDSSGAQAGLDGNEAAAYQTHSSSLDVSSGHEAWQDSLGIPNESTDLFPEIENFLAEFDRSDFIWSFPLNAIGDPYNADIPDYN
ncbi:hypothetical protein G7Z17_g2341 [Cylindrodendrum hubeiense]|uniref:Xylanolytic transcriptional activator regulatory domain-containing protein n=1 Tax=Cylindrodendrum hubeiense TaxID=595255 RepID=A0A9P5LKE6_9HYPO|nr:hypothetical protein G7Z17_g2341 [Cylindrodendrum hubeiense]